MLMYVYTRKVIIMDMYAERRRGRTPLGMGVRAFKSNSSRRQHQRLPLTTGTNFTNEQCVKY